MNPLEAAARFYAAKGWRVVPLHDVTAGHCSCHKGAACTSAGKHPRPERWGEQATDDVDKIEGWWDAWPNANVGIATGHGFFVFDVDPDKGGDKTLAALVAVHGPLPETPQQKTGSGGSHYAFQIPDFEVSNSAGNLGSGLDIRGKGGQIVVSPSRSAKGTYSWVHSPATPIAPAPDWLLDLLRSQPKRRSASPGAKQTPVKFLPAQPAVVAQAAAALREHGPAIEGQGGDQHTFVAAAILRNDFALEVDQAWPLLLEWNLTCVPPWDDDDLMAKLDGGGKYTSAPFGSRRTADMIESVRATIAEWRNGPDAGSPMTVVALCRPFAAAASDVTLFGMIEGELVAATGMKAKLLGLTRPRPQLVVPEGAVGVSHDIHTMANEAEARVTVDVFQRAGVLCQVNTHDGRVAIDDMKQGGLLDLISKRVEFVRADKDGATVKTAPPDPVVRVLHDRMMHKGVRAIVAVTNSPLFMADGSILSQKGYNSRARLWLEPSVSVDVPDYPTHEDAQAAVEVFRDLLGDYKFVSAADFGAWMAGMLTPLVKSAIDNAPAPLVCVSASSPGAGKTMLADLACRIVTGAWAEIRTYAPKDQGEWSKRITSYVRAASPVGVFDNVNGAFGDEQLDRLVTSSTWSDRVLGASEAPPVTIVTTWWATGNNIEPVGDTVRRVLPIRIEVDTERPQERTGFKRPDLKAYVAENRSELLSAALTILRAYHVAGRPQQDLPAWGSFNEWSKLVRQALVWCGVQDPFLTQRRVSMDVGDTESDAHDFWLDVVEKSDGFAASIVELANLNDGATILGVREMITAHSLKKFISRFIDRPRAGRRIRRERENHNARYLVEKIVTEV